MEKGYKNIFWGLFIATFNINFGFIKVLPAFVGWMILHSGIDILKEEFKSESFVKGGKYSKFLIVLSIIGGLISLNINAFFLFKYFPIFVEVLELLTIFYIIEGSIEYLKANEVKVYPAQYEANLKTYTISFCIVTLLISIGLTLNNSILSIGAILAIVLRIVVMVMINNFKKMILDESST